MGRGAYDLTFVHPASAARRTATERYRRKRHRETLLPLSLDINGRSDYIMKDPDPTPRQETLQPMGARDSWRDTRLTLSDLSFLASRHFDYSMELTPTRPTFVQAPRPFHNLPQRPTPVNLIGDIVSSDSNAKKSDTAESTTIPPLGRQSGLGDEGWGSRMTAPAEEEAATPGNSLQVNLIGVPFSQAAHHQGPIEGTPWCWR